MKSTRIALVIAATVGGLVAPQTAHAATQPVEPVGSKSTSRVVNPDCLAQLPSTVTSHDVCVETTDLTVSPETVVTREDLADDDSLSLADKSDILEAVERGTVKAKHYSKATTGIIYTATNSGTFYYNGSRAWVGSTYAGKKGSHSCSVNYSAGVSIARESCSESGSTSTRRMYFQWRVSWWPGPPYFGASYSINNAVQVRANGTAS